MQSVRLTAATGEVWTTSVNAPTKEDAESYFLNKQFNIGKPHSPDEDNVVTVVKVEWWPTPLIPDEDRTPAKVMTYTVVTPTDTFTVQDKSRLTFREILAKVPTVEFPLTINDYKVLQRDDLDRTLPAWY